ncbi:MAG: hypothetical protein U0441_21910 [Polyangiaceae bacterium]
MNRKRTAFVGLVVAALAVVIFLATRPAPQPTSGTAVTAVSPVAPLRTVKSPPRPASTLAGATTRDPVAEGPTTGVPVFKAKWGSAPDELGRDRPNEGNPMGPMSMAVDAKGRMYVLDEINGRIVRRGADGKVEATISSNLIAPQDMAVAADGSTLVLDRFVDKQVAIYDESGRFRGDIPIEGEGVEDVGQVTGVFADGNDIYVEREHGELVKLGDTSGNLALPRTELPGRPSRDGTLFLNAGITDAQVGRVYVSAIDRSTNNHRFTRELRLRSFVRAIVLLDSDLAGTIYFASEVEVEGGNEVVLLTCLEPLKGTPVGGAVLPVNTLPEETFRDLTVQNEGGVLYAQRTDEGVTYVHYDCE